MKTFKGTFLAAALAGVMSVQSSQAVMVATNKWEAWGSNEPSTTPRGFSLGLSCVLLRPLCFLNQDGKNSETALDRNELVDEYGYSDVEAGLLISEQAHFAKAMKDKKLKLVITEKDTAQSLKKQIKDVYPNADDFFVNNYVELVGFNEQ